MPKKRPPKAIKRFMTLLSANVLGNIIRNAQRVDEFKSHLIERNPGFYEKYARLSELPAWNSFGEVLSSQQLRGLLDVVTAFAPREGDGLVWYDTYLGLGEKVDVIDDFKLGGLSDLFASDWKEEANRFATGARGQSLSEAIEAAGSLQALTEELSKRLRPIKSGEDHAEVFDATLPLDKQPLTLRTVIAKVATFLSKRSDLKGESGVKILEAIKIEEKGINNQNFYRAIKWLAKHPNEIHCPASSSTSTSPSPAAPHRAP